MFNPGDNVSHTFVIPFPVSSVKEIVVTYRQDGRLVIVKEVELPIIYISENKSQFSVTFTQQESLLFDDKKNFTIQINLLIQDDDEHITRVSSKEISSCTGVQHYRQVMNNA